MDDIFVSDDESTEETEVLFSPPKESESIGIRLMFYQNDFQKVWINAQVESKNDTLIFYRYYVLTDINSVSSVRGVVKRLDENEKFQWLINKIPQFELSQIYPICSTMNTIFINSKKHIKFISHDTIILNIKHQYIETEKDKVKLTHDILWCTNPYVSAYTLAEQEMGIVNLGQLCKIDVQKSTKDWASLVSLRDEEKSLLESLLFSFHLNATFQSMFVIGISGPMGCGKSFVVEAISKLMGRFIVDFDEKFCRQFSHEKIELDSFLFFIKNPTDQIISSVLQCKQLPLLIVFESDNPSKIPGIVNYHVKLSSPTNEVKSYIGCDLPQWILNACSNFYQVIRCQKLFQMNKELFSDQSLLHLVVEQITYN